MSKDLSCHIGTTICFWLGLGFERRVAACVRLVHRQAEPGSPAPRSNSDSGRNPALAMKLLTEGNARFALGGE